MIIQRDDKLINPLACGVYQKGVYSEKKGDLKMGAYGLFLTRDELNRVTINESDKILVLDVHGLNKNETAKLMNNLIAATRNAFTFRIIHGYNHGVVLKTFINNEYKNKRVENIVSMVNNNLGMTDLYVKNA